MSSSPSYVHRGGETPLIGSTIDAFLRGVMRRFPDRDAVVSIPQDTRLSYAGLDDAADRIAAGLIALGVGRGDRVGIWSTDNVEWVMLQVAAARVGAILVNVNPAYRSDELRHALELARVQVLFLIPSFRSSSRSSSYTRMVCELCPEATRLDPQHLRTGTLPDLRHLVVYDPADAASTVRPERGFLTWPELLEMGRRVTPERIDERAASLDPDDPVNIQFTSGTTGAPKAVVLTHHNVLNNGYFAGRIMRFSAADRLCVPVPFYHCFGMVVANLSCLTHGAAIVIPAPHFEAGATLEAIERERCTAVHGVPTMFVAELERPELRKRDLSSLRTGIMAGAPCPPQLVRRVMEEMGCRELLLAYGLTETSPITHITRPDDTPERRVGTVGTNMPHQEVKLVAPGSGAIVPVGRPGEVCVRGYHVMRGYYGQEDATASAIDEAGWLHSGDLGVLDQAGYLRITGRLKDMIIRGGENIYPAEVEAFYFEHPEVAQVAVFGVPDPLMGEEVGAWFKLHDGAHADPEELKAFAEGRIAHYKVPRHVWIVDEFPMTVTGKVQKFRIKKTVARWMSQRERDAALER